MGCKNHPAVEENLLRCSRCLAQFCPDCRVELGGQVLCADCKHEQVRDIQSGADASIGPVTPVMVQQLRGTKGWVRLLSIIGFLGAGLMLIAGGVMAALSSVGAGGESPFGPVGGIALGLLYLVFAVVYFFMSLLLHRYAGAIGGLVRTRQVAFMEAALSHQRSFWRLVGVITVVGIVVWIVVMIGLLIAGAMAAVMAG
jgi:hypothetical protein